MNAWNSAWVQENYNRQSAGYVTTINGNTQVEAPAVGNEIRKLVHDEGVSPNDPDTVARSRRAVVDAHKCESLFQQPLFGYVAEWLSELGKEEELASLLADIDEKHPPCWEDGGLRYARDDRVISEKGDWRRMDPFSGNAGIAYSRLNVTDGQKIMWERPRERGYWDKQPFVDGFDLGDGIDCLRGTWLEDRGVMIVTLKALRPVALRFSIRNLKAASWGLYVAGNLVQATSLANGGDIDVQHKFLAAEEVDFIVLEQS